MIDRLWFRRICGLVAAAVAWAGLPLPGLPVSQTVRAQSDAVVISEIFYNAPGSAEGHEFVELANRSADPVDVSDWQFSAGVSYRFPAGTVLAAGEHYAIAAEWNAFVTAFGANPDGVYTGNLSNGGETLTLVDDAAVSVDTVAYDDQSPWPVEPDGDGKSLQLADLDADNAGPDWWAAGDPTPGAANAADPGVIFSHRRGFYDQSLTITLTPTIAGATISYATDNGDLAPYTGPVTISDNGTIGVIRARASHGGTTSDIVSHTYVFHPDEGVPVVAIWANGMSPANGDTRTGNLEVVMPPSTGLDSIASAAGFSKSGGGVEGGQSDKVYFRSEYGAGTLHADLFSDFYYGPEPTTRHDQLVLRAEHQDTTLMRQAIALDMLLAMGQIGPHGRHVRFYDGGSAEGARLLQERPEGGFMESYFGGDKNDYYAGRALDSTNRSKLPARPSGAADYDRFISQVDIENLLDASLSLWFANMWDAGSNWRYAGPETTASPDAYPRARFFNWDHDVGYAYGPNYSPMTGWPQNSSRPVGQYSPGWYWYASLRVIPRAVDAMSDRIECHMVRAGGAMTLPEILGRIDARQPQLVAAGGPANAQWRSEVETWSEGRLDWLLNWMRTVNYRAETDAVTVTVSNGQMVISGGHGPIYYRTDGGDPRGDDRTPSSDAILYTAPVTLPAGVTHVIARSYDSAASGIDKWSPACTEPLALAAAPVGAGSLVINEINYNPDAAGAEFIELVNDGTAAVALGGMSLGGAISATLPAVTVNPDEYFVVADSATAFEAAYGFAPDATFAGELANRTATVELFEGATVLDTVTYADTAPWPNAPDGTGPSLSLVDPSQDNATPSAWKPSAELGGSPGRANTFASLPQPGLTQLASTETGDGLDIGWSMSGTSGVSHYLVRVSGNDAPTDPISVQGAAATSITVDGLLGGNGYCVSVQAVGTDGSVSERSSTECVDTFDVAVGDVDCDDVFGVNDVESILGHLVELRVSKRACPLTDPDTEIHIVRADVDRDGSVALRDAWLVAQCVEGETNELCGAQ